MTTPESSVMKVQEASRLAAMSRQARWDYPSSQGRPIEWDKQPEWLDTLIREQSSFVEAAKTLMENGQADLAVEMAANVWRLWILSRDVEEGRKFLATILDEGKARRATKSRALSLYGDGLFALRQGKIKESRNRNEDALKIAEQIKDPESESLSHLGLSKVDFEEGNYQSALFHASKARKLVSGLTEALGQGPLFMQAQSTRMLGDYGKAATLFQQSIDLNRKIGDRGMVIAEHINHGFVEVHLGNVVAANRDFEESDRLDSSNSDPYFHAMNILAKADVEFLKGNHAEAHSLLTESEKILKDSNMQVGADDGAEFDFLRKRLAETSRR